MQLVQSSGTWPPVPGEESQLPKPWKHHEGVGDGVGRELGCRGEEASPPNPRVAQEKQAPGCPQSPCQVPGKPPTPWHLVKFHKQLHSMPLTEEEMLN